MEASKMDENSKLPRIDLGIGNRMFIMQTALVMEGMTSMFLGGLLNIKEPKKSRTLGNTGSALSFKNKIELLMDIGAIDEDLRSKFLTFMEIRNQFVHNMEAKTYEACLLAAQKDTWILGKYPQGLNIDKETQLRNACDALAREVFSATLNVIKVVEGKIKADAEALVTSQSHEAFKRSIPQLEEHLNSIFKEFAIKKDLIESKELVTLGTTIKEVSYKLWGRNFDEIVKKAEKDKEK